MCEKCLKNLCDVYNFVQKCQESEDSLNSILQQSTEASNTYKPVSEMNQHQKSRSILQRDPEIRTEIEPDNLTLEIKNEPLESEGILSSIIEIDGHPTSEIKVDSDELQSILNSYSDQASTVAYNDYNNKSNQKETKLQKPDIFYCGICNITFETIEKRRAHYATTEHQQQKRYSCDLCSERFICPAALQRHGIYHTNERPFKCNVCPATFRKNFHLRRHTLIHTGVRRHICEKCGKGK